MVEVSKSTFMNKYLESRNFNNRRKSYCFIFCQKGSTFLGHPVPNFAVY